MKEWFPAAYWYLGIHPPKLLQTACGNLLQWVKVSRLLAGFEAHNAPNRKNQRWHVQFSTPYTVLRIVSSNRLMSASKVPFPAFHRVSGSGYSGNRHRKRH